MRYTGVVVKTQSKLASRNKRFTRRAGGGNGRAPYPLPILQKLKRIASQVPAAEWDTLPADLTDNLDHYLYGAPKK